MRRIGWAVVAAALMAGPAFGQAKLADPEANIVEELVVQAKEAGPAWWRVKDGDTTVWILGVGDDGIPTDIPWSRTALQRRMTGANSLILGTRINIRGGVGDIPALLRARAKLRSKTPVEQALPPPLSARFTAARTRIGKPPERYKGWGPLVASSMLLRDSREGRKTVSVADAVVKEARRRRVKTETPASYKARPMLATVMGSISQQGELGCVRDALDDIETPDGVPRAAARGWANGDVRGALREARGFEKCILFLSGGETFWRGYIDDEAEAIQAALAKPGHAVAIMGLRPLLAEGGIIETLEAKGVTVLGPGEAG